LTRLAQLVEMSRALGSPYLDYVILSEGNTSAKVDNKSFWVKASGSRMADAESDAFLQVDTAKVLNLVNGPTLGEDEMRRHLAEATIEEDSGGSPSIETGMHAVCLTMGRATFVGHTHPTAINGILCAKDGAEAFARPIFPAESLVCGEPVFVPYGGPGQALARAVRGSLESALRERGEAPRVLLLQNHGLVALGNTAQEVLDITEMMVKTARILARTYTLNGPHFIDYR
jgi:rhamnose utilization protein RhaD (predicted bifunctional aldolase and dehydrogenase)